MTTKFWWLLLTVLTGAVVAGSLLAVQYAKQQVTKRVHKRIWFAMACLRCGQVRDWSRSQYVT